MEGIEGVAASFVHSNKKKKVLVDSNNYEYILKYARNGSTYWECRKKKKTFCTATAITKVVDDVETIKTLKVLFCYFFYYNMKQTINHTICTVS